MRNLLSIFCIACLGFSHALGAEDGGPLDYTFTFALEQSELDGLSLGASPAEDRLDEREVELEIDLAYRVSDKLRLFLVVGLIDESETVESAGTEEALSGLERKEIGIAYAFGETVESELTLGRMEFVSTGEWWLWWDEELDAVRVDTAYRDFEFMLGFAREQARATTDDDFIDPEIQGLERMLASFGWEFGRDQALQFYYLAQDDGSRSHRVGDFEDARKIDEEDADLDWIGISYLGGFEIGSIGDIEIEIHGARVEGRETVYEFGDPAAGLAEVEGRERVSVDGEAHSLFVGWRPAALEGWRFTLGRVAGSGDRNPGDARDDAYRQTGLQGESELYGELFQPEISNLVVNSLGVEWDGYGGVRLALTGFDFRQDNLDDEMRGVAIETDPNAASRDLGREIDLVATITAWPDIEVVLKYAEFDPGKAYGSREGDASRFVGIEIEYEF